VTKPPRAEPLKPRPRLFAAQLANFAIWVGALLAMYFKTVYPNRHRATTQDARLNDRT
jgi:hypothetical protein